MKLGFLDSGLGGLFVMERVQEMHPEHEYVFLGDTKNLPYGPRSSQEIADFIDPLIRYLFEQQMCDHVIVACNTASVRAVPIFLAKYPEYLHRVHRIDIPTKQALGEMNLDELLVLATQQTVMSGAYLELEQKGIHVSQQAMPGLVDLIEAQDWQGAHSMCTDALLYYPKSNAVLLGCTHYLWLEKDLSLEYPEKRFIGQHQIVARYIETLTQVNNEVENATDHKKETLYLVTGDEKEYSEKHQRKFIKLAH
jgi:glutamate racemase